MTRTENNVIWASAMIVTSTLFILIIVALCSRIDSMAEKEKILDQINVEYSEIQAESKTVSVRIPKKQVFKDLLNAEDKADKEAMELYSMEPMKYIDKVEELEKKYKKTVRNKWGITKEQEKEIVIEGVKKRWDL